MIRAKTVLCILFAGTAVALAQEERTIPALEVYQVGAPVRIAGEVIAKDQASEVPRYSFESDLNLTNESAKSILLMILKLDVISTFKISLNYTEVDDYFFESSIPKPGSTVTVHRFLGRFGEPAGAYESFTAEPSAHARVAFVQFVDGSRWGDVADAEGALRDRRFCIKQLELLRERSRKKNRDEFLKALSQPTTLQPISNLQDLYRKKGDLSLVLARLDDMLKNAGVRNP